MIIQVGDKVQQLIWAKYNDLSRRVVTLNGGLVRESSQNPLNSGLGIILICPDSHQKVFSQPPLGA